MNLHEPNNLELLKDRHSVRNFSDRPIESGAINSLRALVTMINTHEAGMKFQLMLDEGAPFKGFTSSYGVFKGVRNYLACVVDPAFDHASERAGYFAQSFVIRALELGLGACFVSGTYNRDAVGCQMRAGEKLLFVVPFGYPAESGGSLVSRVAVKMMHRKKFELRDFFQGDEENYNLALQRFPWLPAALEAVACSPSARNKRPVRLCYDVLARKSKLCALVDGGNPSNLIDLGIAKYNITAVAPDGEWEWGNCKPYILF